MQIGMKLSELVERTSLRAARRRIGLDVSIQKQSSKSLNYNGKERLWKTSMSREEGKRKSRITWKRDRT